MIDSQYQKIIKELRTIPGVGESISRDLYELGIRRIDVLADQDPEELYERLCQKTGAHVDRCVLYVFRCAVYYAQTPNPEPELLKWWNWKNLE